jgi:predicted DNA-binding protein with PD1-like motif
MQSKNYGNIIVAHIQTGEEILKSVKKIAKQYDLDGAFIQMIGTTKKLTLGFFDKEVNQYSTMEYDEDMEMINVTGSISTKPDGDIVVHLHGIFGDDEFKTQGGHVMSAEVLATVEAFIFPTGKIERSLNDKFNLFLFDLQK